MKKHNGKKGFTLVELIVVIAVIGILAAVLIPTFGNVIENANKSSVTQTAKNLATQVNAGLAESLKITTVNAKHVATIEYFDDENFTYALGTVSTGAITLYAHNGTAFQQIMPSNTTIYAVEETAKTTYFYYDGSYKAFGDDDEVELFVEYDEYADLAAAKIPYRLLVAMLQIDGVSANADVTFTEFGFRYVETKNAKAYTCVYNREEASYTVTVG